MQPEREVEALHEAFFFNIYIPAKSLHVACIKLKTDKKCLDVTHFEKNILTGSNISSHFSHPSHLQKLAFKALSLFFLRRTNMLHNPFQFSPKALQYKTLL